MTRDIPAYTVYGGNPAKKSKDRFDDELKELLDVSELLSVTREQIEQELETVLDLIDTGHSPILITADGKPDLLMFSWSDYKRRFSILYPLGELERVEEEMQRQKETQ